MRATIALTLAAGMAAAAPSPGLVEADGPADVAALVLSDPGAAAETLLAADLLGLGDPVAVIFAALSPETPAAEAEALAVAAVTATPQAADQIVAAVIAATDIGANQARLNALIAAIMPALTTAGLTPEVLATEVLEILSALASLADPGLLPGLADQIAALTPDPGDDGGSLLAALGPGVETGATQTPFGDSPPPALTITPASAAQDAPSAN